MELFGLHFIFLKALEMFVQTQAVINKRRLSKSAFGCTGIRLKSIESKFGASLISTKAGIETLHSSNNEFLEYFGFPGLKSLVHNEISAYKKSNF